MEPKYAIGISLFVASLIQLINGAIEYRYDPAPKHKAIMRMGIAALFIVISLLVMFVIIKLPKLC
jgi:hypothetical protein